MYRSLIANGIDIIRIFDCFNDLRNLKSSVEAVKLVKKENPNAHAQIALCYTLGDAYTLDYWKETAKRIEDMGADSICIKDMAGLLVPAKATRTCTGIKGWFFTSYPDAYTLYIRCCFNDIYESC